MTIVLAGMLAVAWYAAASAGTSRVATAAIAYSCAGDICTMSADGSHRLRLTHDKFIDAYPNWAPDGRRIAFTSNLGRTVIDVMDADGSNRRRLTPPGGDDALPAWSPDGRTIAFDDNTTGTIDLMNADGSARRKLLPGSASLPAWSPDGTRIAFVAAPGRRLALTHGEIDVVDISGTNRRRLISDGSFPAWSPDGTRIAFLHPSRRPSTEADVWIVDADGSDPRRVWRHAARGNGLSWSPDAASLAIASVDDEVYIVRLGRGARRLTSEWRGAVDPAFRRAFRLPA